MLSKSNLITALFDYYRYIFNLQIGDLFNFEAKVMSHYEGCTTLGILVTLSTLLSFTL